jgi:hypothetical protein
MEAEVYWPRLQQVIDEKHLTAWQDQRILLDFCLVSASLAFVYGFLAMLVGPWLWYRPRLWVYAGVGSLALGYLFYRVGVVVADGLGDLSRASYDLFRLDLLEKLGAAHPTDTAKEREMWEKLSKVIVYGEEHISSKDEVELHPRSEE